MIEVRAATAAGWQRSIGSMWVMLLLLAATAVQAAAPEYAIAPPPSWVIPVEPGEVDPAVLGQLSNGEYYLLSDSQLRSSPDARVRYRRTVSKAVNTRGVESISNIQIGFDPSYERISLHAIDVIRDGRRIPKLALASIRVLQRETELERRIYDGSKTINVFLDDVRVGDSVDFSYSVSGRNPVFGGADFGNVALQFSVPVARLHSRVSLSEDRHPLLGKRNTTIEPAISMGDGYRHYRWDQRSVAALVADADSPAWYSPYPVAQWTDFRDWSAVARWAVPLYQVPSDPGRALQGEIDRIAASSTDPALRLLAALHLAQGEIRYLGIEIGPGSHEPNPPALVFERRFGDCKDKTLLLLTLLDRLGIEARAALVNTEVRRGLRERQPSPAQFDHVIVQAQVAGRSYWLDPTRDLQLADLEHVYQPDFDVALLVAADTTTLTDMKPQPQRVSRRSLSAEFDASAGLDKPVRFTLTTVVEGGRAEGLRATLAQTSFDELQKQYLNYYARYYPGITAAAPMTVSDDATANRMTMVEHYSLADFAIWSDSEQRFSADVAVPDIDEMLRAPASAVRQAPLALAYPIEVVQTTEVKLPETWPTKAASFRVDDPAFEYEGSLTPKPHGFVMTDRYRSRVDEIAAADVARYVGNLNRARDSTGYRLSWAKPAVAGDRKGLAAMNGWLALLATVALAFWIWLAKRAWRYDPPAAAISDTRLQRLGGWLLLVGLGEVVTPFVLVAKLVESAPAFTTSSWTALTSPDSPSYNALWAPLLIFDLVSLVGMLVFSVLMLVLFFLRRSSFPRLYIVMMVAYLVNILVDLMGTGYIGLAETKDVVEVVSTALQTALWTAYMLKSRRVAATFLVRRPTRPAAPVVDNSSGWWQSRRMQPVAALPPATLSPANESGSA